MPLMRPQIVKMTWSHPKMPFPQRVRLLLGSLSPSKFGDAISSFADPGMFIPDPRSRIQIFPSRIPDLGSKFFSSWIPDPRSEFFPSRILDPGSASKNLSILTKKKMVSPLSEMCSGFPSRIRILTFYPSRILILYLRSRI
jgi:hypothetical protein